MIGQRTPEVVLVIGRETVSAVTPGTSAPAAHVGWATRGSNSGMVGQLADAFRHVLGGVGIEVEGRSGVPAALVLRPSVAETRLLDLPPLSPRDAEAVVRRDAGRHFVGASGPMAVAVASSSSSDGAPARTLASASPVDFVEAVCEAAVSVGLTPDRVVPASAIWLDVATKAVPDAGWVVIDIDGMAHAFELRGGFPVSDRQVPAGAIATLARGSLGDASRIAVFGAPSFVESLRVALGGADLVPISSSPIDTAGREATGSKLSFAVPSQAMAAEGARRRFAFRAMVGACVFLILAAAAQIWGLQRELHAARANRAEIRAEVEPLLEARQTTERIEEESEAVRVREEESYHWTPAIADLALLLPRETYVTSLLGSEGLLEIEAAGQWAGEALEALRGAPSLRDVRLVGTVGRDLRNGETVVERFTLRAELAPSDDEGSR